MLLYDIGFWNPKPKPFTCEENSVVNCIPVIHIKMYLTFANLKHLIAQLTLKECIAHCSDGVKICGAIDLIKQMLPKRLPSLTCQNQHRMFNF